MQRVLAVVAALVLLCASAFAAKAPVTPQFAELPFSLTGTALGSGGVAVNDQLMFLNGTTGYTGAIEVTLTVTSGAVSLQACPEEICFRVASPHGGRAYVAAPSILVSAQPWLLVAGGSASDNVPWWFWVSNQDATRAATGTLSIKLLPTVVLGNTSTETANVSLAAGEFRLFKVPARANAGGAIRVSFSEQTAAGTFQFFQPSDYVLPDVQLQMQTPGFALNGCGNELRVDESGTSLIDPAAPQVSGTYYAVTTALSDNTDWWLVAGSRNQQAVNATLTIDIVPTTQLTSGGQQTVTVQPGQIAVLHLDATAGSTGLIKAFTVYNETATLVTARAGVLNYNDMKQLTNATGTTSQYLVAMEAVPGNLGAGVVAGASECVWTDNTDWWVLVEGRTGAGIGADSVDLTLTGVASLVPEASGNLNFNVSADQVDGVPPVSLVYVKAADATSAVLRVQSTFADIHNVVLTANSGAAYSSALPGAICSMPISQPRNGAQPDLEFDGYLASAFEGTDFWVLIGHNSNDEDDYRAGSVQFSQVRTTAVQPGSTTGVTLMPAASAASTYELDFAVLRVAAPAGTAPQGLDVTVKVSRGGDNLYPGQEAVDTAVPPFNDVLDVYAAHDFLFYDCDDVMDNWACGGDCDGELTNSSTVASVSTTRRFWNEQLTLSTAVPPLGVNASTTSAARRELLRSYGSGKAIPGIAIANDAPRVWYILLQVDISDILNESPVGLWSGDEFVLPLDVTVAPVTVLDISSGVPVLSPPSPNTNNNQDYNVPPESAQLYRLRGSAGNSGLASVTTSGTGSGGSAGTLFLSPAVRTTGGGANDNGGGYEESGPVVPPLGAPSSSSYYLRTSWSADLGLRNPGITRRTGSAQPYALQYRSSLDQYLQGPGASPARAVVSNEGGIRVAWLQAADNADDVDWYVTLLTPADATIFSFTVTLHSTVSLLDSPTDDFGALRWSASGVPLSASSQYLFKLPARFTLRGIISAITLVDTASGAAIDATSDNSPLALTLQAQTVPSARAGIVVAAQQQEGDNTVAGSTFSLPFATTSPTVQQFGALAYPAVPAGSNNDFSDVYLLGTTRNNYANFTSNSGTRIVSLQVTVGQTSVLCNKKITCNNKGKCLSDGSCDCNSGYGGQFCTCRDKRDCSGHGICALTQGCVCDEGYSGADCSRSGASALAVASLLAAAVAALVAALF